MLRQSSSNVSDYKQTDYDMRKYDLEKNVRSSSRFESPINFSNEDSEVVVDDEKSKEDIEDFIEVL